MQASSFARGTTSVMANLYVTNMYFQYSLLEATDSPAKQDLQSVLKSCIQLPVCTYSTLAWASLLPQRLGNSANTWNLADMPTARFSGASIPSMTKKRFYFQDGKAMNLPVRRHQLLQFCCVVHKIERHCEEVCRWVVEAPAW